MKKSTIRFFVFVAPLLLIFCIVTILFSFAQIHHVTKETVVVHRQEAQGQELADLKLKTESLIREKAESAELNAELLNKINSKGLSGLNPLVVPFFNPVQGAQDLSKDGQAGIQDQKLTSENGKLHLTFNIVNNRKDGSKLSGHIAVVLKSASLSMVYPYPSNLSENSKPLYMTFNMGESFSTSRFRPVDAIFNLPGKLGSPTFFDVIVFSKTGDLLLRQTIGPLSTSTASASSNSNDANI